MVKYSRALSRKLKTTKKLKDFHAVYLLDFVLFDLYISAVKNVIKFYFTIVIVSINKRGK